MKLPNNTLLQGGKYKIIRFISSGGFGCTYEAEHTIFNVRVAIKEFFVKDFCNRDEQTNQISVATQSKFELVGKLKKKFMDEAKSVFQMNHPNIVRVTDIFEENGTAYYVMEYIDGESLHDKVKCCGKLAETEALGYIRQVADALAYVHGMNRLHLDIKPGNIMVDKQGHVMLIDFGASKHYDDETGENTSTLMGVNTKGYAPVEQVTASFTHFSPATDIYALGATLYKLLTGITPPGSVELLSKLAQLQPLSSHISQSTRSAIEKAMQLSRFDRYQRVADFMDAINSVPVVEIDEDHTTIEDVPTSKSHMAIQEEQCESNKITLKELWKSRPWTVNCLSIMLIVFFGLVWCITIYMNYYYYSEYDSLVDSSAFLYLFLPYIGLWGVVNLMYANKRYWYVPLIIYSLYIPYGMITLSFFGTLVLISAICLVYVFFYMVIRKTINDRHPIALTDNATVYSFKNWTIASKIVAIPMIFFLIIGVLGVASNDDIAYYRFALCELLAISFCAYLLLKSKIIGLYLAAPILIIGYTANLVHFGSYYNMYSWIVEMLVTICIVLLLISMFVRVKGKRTIDFLR